MLLHSFVELFAFFEFFVILVFPILIMCAFEPSTSNNSVTTPYFR